MPAKAKLPQPIDRPLSRAYLREFSGWSTAYPPGLSEPTSLRVMENVLVNRDGSAGVRPGLRYVAFEDYDVLSTPEILVGTHEVFFAEVPDPENTKYTVTEKAYLFAARVGSYVEFFVAVYNDETYPFLVVPAEDIFDMEDPTEVRFTGDTTYVKYLQIDNKILALSDNGEKIRVFYVDAVKRVVVPQLIDQPEWTEGGRPLGFQPLETWISAQPADETSPRDAYPAQRTYGSDDLISTTTADNVYTLGFFYTFFNELGESAPSQVWTVKIQRPWTAWLDTVTGGDDASNPAFWLDQFILRGPRLTAQFQDAVEAGALGLHMYMAAWGPDESVPNEGILIGSRTFESPTVYGLSDPPANSGEWDDYYEREAYVRVLGNIGLATRTQPMPSLATRRNYTDPSRAGNGIVAADRMILVNDPTQPAVIRWTSNLQGEYLNFTASRGGGFKTLTSGNLFIPATVVLWQNPQSVDTLCILCRGVDGLSTGYYMAPAEITSQSESTAVMGFEETSASPGTTSPFGCEVFNNALYHPLDEQLQKSTAANYAIRHKSLTDLIVHEWQGLATKEKIISGEYDGRIYYIVNNPDGAELEEGCNGNEVWVLDAAAEKPAWNRWLVQGVALRKVELFGLTYMSLVRPDGIYVFDPAKSDDDVVEATGEGTVLLQMPIPWRLETNTQGANRAHDAWARFQLAQITLGNFVGKVKWGVRGWDINGRPIEIEKQTTLETAPDNPEGVPWDLEDQLQIRRDMKEWVFFAGSALDEADIVEPFAGQINLVQYRYTPSTVNTGYEMGSVETFEYGSSVTTGTASGTDSGVPIPFNDQRAP